MQLIEQILNRQDKFELTLYHSVRLQLLIRRHKAFFQGHCQPNLFRSRVILLSNRYSLYAQESSRNAINPIITTAKL